jgi:hypothetical protein
MAKDKDPFICKHDNDIETCKEVCVCTHGCEWHGKGSCGLCDCIKWVKPKAKKAKEAK